MRVLSLGMSALLGAALAATASAQVAAQKIDPTPLQKAGGAPSAKGSSSPRSLLGTSQFGGGMIFVSTNDCTAPTAINGDGTHPFDTTAATTSGFSGGGFCGGGSTSINQDLFWQWTATVAGDVQFDTFGSTFDTKLSVHSGIACAATCVGYNDDTGGLQSRVIVSGVNIGDTFVVQVGGFGSSSGTGVLNIAALVPPANDLCSTATPISGSGTHPFQSAAASTSGFDGGGSCGAGADTINQDVFWQWTATAAGDFQFDTFGSPFDTKLSVHAGVGCAATCVGYNDDTGGLQSRVLVLGVNIGDTFLVQVGGFGSASGSGVLNIDLYVDPCALPPDPFEPNNDCPQAVPIGDGVYSNLNVSKTDWDYYEVQVADGATLDVDVIFVQANGDIDLFLYLAADCQPFGAGDVGCASTIACAYTFSTIESISWTNTTGISQTCIIKVNVWPPTTTGDCNTYEMVVAGAGAGIKELCNGNTGCPCLNDNDGSLGVAGCANSAFPSGARATAVGTYPAAMQIQGTNVQPNQFAIALRGSNKFEPGAPIFDGLLCVGGATARSNAFFSNVSGVATSPILPQGPAGVQWNYQLWYRDTGLCQGSNLSNAVGITW